MEGHTDLTNTTLKMLSTAAWKVVAATVGSSSYSIDPATSTQSTRSPVPSEATSEIYRKSQVNERVIFHMN